MQYYLRGLLTTLTILYHIFSIKRILNTPMKKYTRLILPLNISQIIKQACIPLAWWKQWLLLRKSNSIALHSFFFLSTVITHRGKLNHSNKIIEILWPWVFDHFLYHTLSVSILFMLVIIFVRLPLYFIYFVTHSMVCCYKNDEYHPSNLNHNYFLSNVLL